jgi:muconate cycloisomerase
MPESKIGIVRVARVIRVETIPCRLPRRQGWKSGVLNAAREERLLVRLITEDGVEGWGEATALPRWGGIHGRHYGETIETATHVIHDFAAPTLLGSDAMSPAAVMEGLEAVIRGHPYAKAAVEMALQDIRGKCLGEPVYRLLGGPCRERVRLAHMIGLMSETDALAEAERAIEQDGVAALQVKGGADPDRDVAVVRSLRAKLPGGCFLRLDANRAYGGEPKTVARVAKRLEAAGVDAIEQPGSSNEVLRACRTAVSVPIIADESCWEPYDVLELWRMGAADAISVYVAKAGGMARAVEVARVAATVGMPCDVNGSFETGIGTAASLHVALACRNATLPSVLSVPSTAERPVTMVTGRYWDDDVVTAGVTYEAGSLRPAAAPGLGVNVDEERVERLAGAGRRVTDRG